MNVFANATSYAVKLALAAVLFCRLLPPGQGRAGPINASTQPAFKNLQVLKDIPSDQLIPSMQFITASLGVDCAYCHVQGAFEKDDKQPKLMARKMMQIMFAINGNTFENQRKVTCYTCHHGRLRPVSVPPVAANEQNASETAAMNDDGEELFSELPPPEEIAAKYAKAVAASSPIATTRTRAEKGRATLPGGKQVPVEILTEAPNKRLFCLHLANGDSITAFDGRQGWLQFPGRPVLTMSNSEAAGASLEAALQFPIELEQLFAVLKVTKLVKVGQEGAYVVQGSNPGQTPAEMYFSHQSGLLLRLIRYTDSALGLIPTQIDYDDYRDIGSMKVPYRWIIARPGGRLIVQIDKVEQGTPLDDSKFARPKETISAVPTSSR